MAYRLPIPRLNRPGFHRDSGGLRTDELVGVDLTVVVCFELGRRDLADLVVDAAVVEPVDVGERRPLDVLDALRSTGRACQPSVA